jgi:hypothetical protein
MIFRTLLLTVKICPQPGMMPPHLVKPRMHMAENGLQRFKMPSQSDKDPPHLDTALLRSVKACSQWIKTLSHLIKARLHTIKIPSHLVKARV